MSPVRSARVVLVTGPAGSGKTTTAKAWASHQRDLTAHFSVDEMGLAVKAGFISGVDGTAEATHQWTLAVAATCAAAVEYASSDVHCGIDAYVLPEHLDLWARLSRFHLRIVVLLPDVEVAVRRNAARLSDNGWGVPEWQVRANHLAMQEWRKHPDVLIVDAGAQPVHEIVAEIDKGFASQ